MVAYNLFPLKMLPMIFNRPYREPVFNLGCLIGFRFDEPRKLLSTVELSALFSNTPDGVAVDAGFAKPRGEFIVTGTAAAPAGEPVNGLQVYARLGGRERILNVYGDRWWRWSASTRGWVPTDPKPFTTMPLSWTRAFGGAENLANPLGLGANAKARIEAGELVQLPNIEDPQRPVVDPGEDYVPVGYGPISPNWSPRQSLIGTLYDDRWLKHEWPNFARDFNIDYFHSAQSQQWMDSYFDGFETFELRNMNAAEPVQTGQLPGIRARCFIAERGPDDTLPTDRLADVPLQLDTVWLLADQGVCLCIHRAAVRVPDSDMRHARALMFALEWLDDQPRSMEYYNGIYQLRMDPEEGYLHALNDRQLTPPLSEAEEAEAAAAQEEGQNELLERYEALKSKLLEKLSVTPGGQADKALATVNENLTKLLGQAEDEITKAGQAVPAEFEKLRALPGEMGGGPADALKSEGFLKVEAAIKELPMISKHDVATMNIDAAGLMAGLDNVTAALDAMSEGVKAMSAVDEASEPAQMLAKLKNVDPGDPKAAALALVSPEHSDSLKEAFETAAEAMASQGRDDPFATPSPEGLLVKHKEWIDFRVFGPSLAPIETPTAEDLLNNGLDLDMKGLDNQDEFEALIKGFAEKNDPRNPDGPAGSNSDPDQMAKALEQQSKEFIEDIKSRLPVAPPEGMPIVSGPLLLDARPYLGEQTEAAVSQQHSLATRDLSEGDFTDRNLSAGDFDGARFKDAVFTRTALIEAKLDGAMLQQTKFKDADLTRASVRGAMIEDASLSGITAAEADFSDAIFKGVIAGPKPPPSDPEHDADAADASAAGDGPSEAATAEAAAPAEVYEGKPIQLQRAVIENATFIECIIHDADLSGATLKGVTFINCDLTGLKLAGANLEATQFVQSKLPRSDLSRAQIKECSFIECEMPDSSWEGAHCELSLAFDTDLTRLNAAGLTGQQISLMQVKADQIVLTNAAVTQFVGMKESSFKFAKIDGVDFIKSSFRTSDLSAANLSGSRFRSCDFGATNLTGANCDMVLFKQTMMPEAIIDGATFRRSNLKDMLMRKVMARGVNFEGAILYAAQPMEGDFREAVFDDAEMTKFDLSTAITEGRVERAE